MFSHLRVVGMSYFKNKRFLKLVVSGVMSVVLMEVLVLGTLRIVV